MAWFVFVYLIAHMACILTVTMRLFKFYKSIYLIMITQPRDYAENKAECKTDNGVVYC